MREHAFHLAAPAEAEPHGHGPTPNLGARLIQLARLAAAVHLGAAAAVPPGACRQCLPPDPGARRPRPTPAAVPPAACCQCLPPDAEGRP